MASKPRRFEANVPVLVTVRCILRLDLFDLAGLRDMIALHLARNASRCGVDVCAWAIQSNHAHFILRQDIDAHCPDRKRGIAAFMRNLNSIVARYGHARATAQGHFLERVYRSHVMSTVDDFVRFIAYVHGQRAHHRLRGRGATIAASSAGVLEHGVPDGIVELLPDGPLFTGLTLEERCERLRLVVARIVRDACAAEREVAALDQPGTTLTRRQLKAMRRDAWRAATRRIMADFGLPGIGHEAKALTFVSLASLVGDEAVTAARQRVLDTVWVRNEPDLRRAPRVGEVITIRVRYERPPDTSIA